MAFMKRNLNGSRRHPMAAILVIAAGLAVSGGGYAAATAAVQQANPTTAAASSAQIDEGHKLFLANCASCHGKNGEGSANAPSLIGVGAASAAFQVGTGRMPGQASGPQLMVKPVQFTEDEIAAIAAYVGSLGPGPAIPTADQIAPNGNATRGGELFRINCAMCHNAVGAGGALTQGKYAPALTNTKAEHIYEAMLSGPQNMPVFNDANLTPTDKKDIITYLTYVQKNPSAGGYELGNLGPVVEGLFIWIFVLGLIITITIWLGAKSN
jgi:ubiquinol-cytochrome c reductase cytochrome c subunit